MSDTGWALLLLSWIQLDSDRYMQYSMREYWYQVNLGLEFGLSIYAAFLLSNEMTNILF